MVGGVRHQAAVGQPVQRLGHVGVRGQADGQHHRPAAEGLAGGQRDPEAGAAAVDAADGRALQRRYAPVLEPQPVADELGDRDGVLVSTGDPALGRPEVFEPVAAGRVGDGRGAGRGLQVHAGRHAVAPAVHRLAEDSDRDAVPGEVRGRGESVRPRADHRDVDVGGGRHGRRRPDPTPPAAAWGRQCIHIRRPPPSEHPRPACIEVPGKNTPTFVAGRLRSVVMQVNSLRGKGCSPVRGETARRQVRVGRQWD